MDSAYSPTSPSAVRDGGLPTCVGRRRLEASYLHFVTQDRLANPNHSFERLLARCDCCSADWLDEYVHPPWHPFLSDLDVQARARRMQPLIIAPGCGTVTGQAAGLRGKACACRTGFMVLYAEYRLLGLQIGVSLAVKGSGPFTRSDPRHRVPAYRVPQRHGIYPEAPIGSVASLDERELDLGSLSALSQRLGFYDFDMSSRRLGWSYYFEFWLYELGKNVAMDCRPRACGEAALAARLADAWWREKKLGTAARDECSQVIACRLQIMFFQRGFLSEQEWRLPAFPGRACAHLQHVLWCQCGLAYSVLVHSYGHYR